MTDDLNIELPQADPPDPAVMRRISAQLAAVSSEIVRPLPGNGVLMAIGLALFALLSLAIAAVVKLKALAALSSGEKAAYYGLVALFAVLFARAVIERMIPGAKRVIPATALWLTAIVALPLLAAFLFSDHGVERFVVTGIPCLRLGVISTLIGGLLGWRLLRRGYLVSPGETVLLYGFFAGLVGIAVLALHCPIRNSLHFLAWHLGAMILAGLAGLLLGRHFENAD